jgi:hypothetical protein
MERIMTASLSQDLRARIVRAVQNGSSIRQAATRYEPVGRIAIGVANLSGRHAPVRNLSGIALGGFREQDADVLARVDLACHSILLR